MEKRRTLVLGASEKTERYSNMAIRSLVRNGELVAAVGRREGEVSGVIIETGMPPFEDIETVTMYLSANNQKGFYDYILSLHPKRIIYNPGAENQELEKLAAKKGIENIEACTLVMLNTGQY